MSFADRVANDRPVGRRVNRTSREGPAASATEAGVERRDILRAAAVLAAAGMSGEVRATVARPEDRWDLTPLYADTAAWEADARRARDLIARVGAFRGRLGQDAGALFDALKSASDARRLITRLRAYAHMKADEDMRASIDQARSTTANDLVGDLEHASAFIRPEVVSLGRAGVDAAVAADPRLELFRFSLDDVLRQADHILGEEAEGVIAATGPAFQGPSEVMQRLSRADIPRPSVRIASGRSVVLDEAAFGRLSSSTDRLERKVAFEVLYAAYRPFRDTLGLDLIAQVRQDEFTALVRKYPDALTAELDPIAVPVQVYRTFIAQAEAGLPLLHRYQDLRRRLLGVDRMAFYDVYAPVVGDVRRFSLRDMRRNLLAAVVPLGRDYGSILAKALVSRWDDPFPRPGKSPSAYMDPQAYDVHPYLFFNLADDYESMSTYAHEWGHAMHSVLANAVQPYEVSDYSSAIAEVPSQLNEILLARYMVSTAKGAREKLFYVIQLLELWSHHFFVSALQAGFADAIHKPVENGSDISGETISASYLGLLRRFYGPAMEIEEIYGLGWMRNFQFWLGYYPYQYGICITAAGAFADRLVAGDAVVREKYLAALRSGGSGYAYDVLKRAGVDLATADPYQRILASFGSLLDEADRLSASVDDRDRRAPR